MKNKIKANSSELDTLQTEHLSIPRIKRLTGSVYETNCILPQIKNLGVI